MAQHRFYATFFVDNKGVVIKKAKPLDYDTRLRIFNRDSKTCCICGAPVKLGGLYDSPFRKEKESCGAIDHIFPIARGGQNDDANLRLLCKSCNSAKGSKWPE